MPRESTTPRGGSAPHWLQRGGFSVFFDVSVDETAHEIWRTRIYHDESGDETVVAGLGTTQWPRWILGRLEADRPPGPDNPVPQVLEVIAEVVDVRVVARTRSSEDVENVQVHAQLRIRGLAALERGVGAAVLDRGVGGPRT